MNSNIILSESATADFAELQTWFKNDYQREQWAGPSILEFEMNKGLQVFLCAGTYQSFSLYQTEPNSSARLIGFGQVQVVGSRAHLGRLAINPDDRRRGLAYILINALIKQVISQSSADIQGQSKSLKQISLFVLNTNNIAKHAYHQYGFVECQPPKTINAVRNCSYMVMHY